MNVDFYIIYFIPEKLQFFLEAVFTQTLLNSVIFFFSFQFQQETCCELLFL